MSETSFAVQRSTSGYPRILHLVETLEVGGTETQLVQTALRQHSRHQNVTIGCLRAEGPLLAPLQRSGIPIVEFRKEKKLLSLKGLVQLLRLALFLRRQAFHVLHAHDMMSNLLGVPAARVAGTPVIISSRRYLAELDWWRGGWRNKIARLMYSLSTHVIVNSTSIRDLLIGRDGVQRKKIHVIYNGVDIDQFIGVHQDKETLLPGVRERSKLVAVVANMDSTVKGHASLIAAAGSVCRHFPDVIFVLIGEGHEQPRLKQQINEAALGKNFLFLGSRKDIPELLACCDLSVLPSHSEGLPNAILEAMAAGLPVIATSVGGVPEVIEDGVTGLLVPPGDPAALSAAILRLLNDEDLRQRLASVGHDCIVKHFGFGRVINALEALYKESSEPFLVREERRQVFQTLIAKTNLADQINE